MKVYLKGKDIVIVERCGLANTFISRTKGLLGKKSISENEGLYFPNCNSIHMFFMRFPIDVLFLDRNQTVVAYLENFKPWRLQFPVKSAVNTLELPTHTIKKHGIKIGDTIVLTHDP
jgi:uncharacterized protein